MKHADAGYLPCCCFWNDQHRFINSLFFTLFFSYQFEKFFELNLFPKSWNNLSCDSRNLYSKRLVLSLYLAPVFISKFKTYQKTDLTHSTSLALKTLKTLSRLTGHSDCHQKNAQGYEMHGRNWIISLDWYLSVFTQQLLYDWKPSVWQ